MEVGAVGESGPPAQRPVATASGLTRGTAQTQPHSMEGPTAKMWLQKAMRQNTAIWWSAQVRWNVLEKCSCQNASF